MNPPLRISVAMTAYNGERFIRAQLESLAWQTRLPNELVVSDDGSTDRTLEVVRHFAVGAPFSVRILTGSGNVGVSKNFERSIAACTGDIIFPCDHDDVWLPNKILETAGVFDRYPSAGIVMSNSEVVSEDLQPLGRKLYRHGFPRTERLYRGGVAAVRFVMGSQITAGHTMAFRAVPFLAGAIAALADGAPYDVICAILLASLGDVVAIPGCLTRYRRHEGQVTPSSDLPSGSVGWLVRRLRGVLVDYEGTSALRARHARSIRMMGARLRDLGAPADIVAFMNGKADIAAFQANLPSSRLRRLIPVLRNLFGGRYHRYAGGVLSAGRDLVIPAPRRLIR